MTVGQLIGILLFISVGFFSRIYQVSRGEARRTAERSPDVAATAVGAAFVDRSAAQALVEILELQKDIAADLRMLVDFGRERREHDSEARLKREMLAQLKSALGGTPETR